MPARRGAISRRQHAQRAVGAVHVQVQVLARRRCRPGRPGRRWRRCPPCRRCRRSGRGAGRRRGRRRSPALERVEDRCGGRRPSRSGAGCPSPARPCPWPARRSRGRASRRRRSGAAPATPVRRPSGPRARRRAISTPMKLAIEAPVTNRPLAVAGKPNSSRIQPATSRSTSIGMWSRPPRLAFRPAASISASMPTGVPPPCTQPMKPGCRLPPP